MVIYYRRDVVFNGTLIESTFVIAARRTFYIDCKTVTDCFSHRKIGENIQYHVTPFYNTHKMQSNLWLFLQHSLHDASRYTIEEHDKQWAWSVRSQFKYVDDTYYMKQGWTTFGKNPTSCPRKQTILLFLHSIQFLCLTHKVAMHLLVFCPIYRVTSASMSWLNYVYRPPICSPLVPENIVCCPWLYIVARVSA